MLISHGHFWLMSMYISTDVDLSRSSHTEVIDLDQSHGRNFVLISPCNTTLNLTIYRIICDIIDKQINLVWLVKVQGLGREFCHIIVVSTPQVLWSCNKWRRNFAKGQYTVRNKSLCTFPWILDRVYHILISKDYAVLQVENHCNWVNVKPVK